jgi:8-amino-7-oxononanoate synthase
MFEAIAGAEKAGATGSRLLSGNAKAWEDLEMEFARFAGSEAALYFGSGYAANLGLLSSTPAPCDTVFSDALNHASLIDGIRLSPAQKTILSTLRHGGARTGPARAARDANAMSNQK